MRICMMSLMMTGMTPEQIVKTAAQCGMTAIDWVTLHGSSPAKLKKLSQDAGLEIVSHTPLNQKFINGDADHWDEFRRSLDDAATMGASVMMVPPFALKKHPALEDGWKCWRDFYADAVPLAGKAGVVLTVESTGFPVSPVTTGDEIMRILNDVPDLKVTFDNGNTATACDFVAAFRMLRRYVVRFHLKDWKIYDAPHPGAERKRSGRYYADSVIGEGDLPLNEFLEMLTPEELEIPFNLETCDPSGKRSSAEVMLQVTRILHSRYGRS